jgi:DNA-binding transcriptional MerR regulator
MDIVEVSRRAGVPASTLRYYEDRGLIASRGRKGLRRLFDEDVLERLALIALARAAGFSLDEIADLLCASSGTVEVDKSRLAAKADELDRQIARLGAMRDGLRHAVACPAPSFRECDHFRRILGVAASGRLGPPSRRAFKAEAV